MVLFTSLFSLHCRCLSCIYTCSIELFASTVMLRNDNEEQTDFLKKKKVLYTVLTPQFHVHHMLLHYIILKFFFCFERLLY